MVRAASPLAAGRVAADRFQRDAGGSGNSGNTLPLQEGTRRQRHREAVPLEAVHLPANPGDGASITLESMSDIVGVNQLAPRQTLVFETGGLTVIYGQSGAGKSGYGRILKRACRSRKAGEIMPDVFNRPPAGRATASIIIRNDGTAQPPISWRDSGGPDPVMSAISVFDKECASVHVQEKNEVAFRPFGLDIPDDLAGACQKLREKLTVEQTQIEALRDPVFEKPTWNPSTSVGRILSSLQPIRIWSR